MIIRNFKEVGEYQALWASVQISKLEVVGENEPRIPPITILKHT